MLVPSLVEILRRAVIKTMTCTSTRQMPSRGKRPGILLVPCRWHKLKSEEEHEGSKTRRRLSAHKGATSLVRRSFPPAGCFVSCLSNLCLRS
ncbi:hypothetical protein GGI35DRAFT_446768 [Trichoderma velutinum]